MGMFKRLFALHNLQLFNQLSNPPNSCSIIFCLMYLLCINNKDDDDDNDALSSTVSPLLTPSPPPRKGLFISSAFDWEGINK